MSTMYRRNNCNAWLYGDQLFIGGAEYVQLFNPKMAGVVDNYLGNTIQDRRNSNKLMIQNFAVK